MNTQISVPNKSLGVFVGLALIFWVSLAHAENKKDFPAMGTQPYVLSKDGQKVPLYDASYALLISATNYNGIDKQGWPKLRTTEKELDEVSDVLRLDGFMVTRVYDPTSVDLTSAYRDFVAKYGLSERNRLLFMFAGHGFTRNDGYGYIVPIDASDPNIDPEGFYKKAKPIKDLVNIAEELSVKHALFVFDSCFSGSLFADRGPTQASAPRSTNQEREDFFRTSAQKPVRQFITAGNENQKVPDNARFGHLMIAGLKGEATQHKDGYVTGKELGTWLEQTVPKFAEGKQSPHSDLIRNSDFAFGDMVFQIPNVSRDINISEAMVGKDCDFCPEMVKLPTGIWMGKYEVTQGQWKAVMGSNPSEFPKCGDNCPIENVSWNDVQVYIQKINGRTGKRYRLPTDDEWFAACRGGNPHSISNKYCGSNNLNVVAWYKNNSHGITHEIGQKKPSPWGLYDMAGNVVEWTSSCLKENDCSQPTRNGGAWDAPEWIVSLMLNSDLHPKYNPGDRYNGIGFRLAKD